MLMVLLSQVDLSIEAKEIGAPNCRLQSIDFVCRRNCRHKLLGRADGERRHKFMFVIKVVNFTQRFRIDGFS